MNIKDFIENMRGCKYITFTLPYVGEITVESIEFKEIVDALEKQETADKEKPRKLLDINGLSKDTMGGRCPICRLSVSEYFSPRYCGSCGQRIDWEE